MHAIGLLSVLALAGSIAAAPVPEPGVVVVTKVATVIVTASAEPTIKATQAPQSYQGQRTRRPVPTAKPATSVYSAIPSVAKPASTAAPTSAKPTYAAPAPASSAPATGGSDYISIANKWRSKMGLPNFTKDDKLQANAKKTAVDGNGQMKHELNPGTMGQVLAPGEANSFEKVFVGGWLCEVPSTPGLDGICSSMSKGWSYQGQTGHNEILVSKTYTKIGCDLANGIWCCDVA